MICYNVGINSLCIYPLDADWIHFSILSHSIESELTALTYNHAQTVKPINSYSERNGHVVAYNTL